MNKLRDVQIKLDKALSIISNIIQFVSGICLIVIIGTFAWLVYGRYILNSTPTWVEQLALILVVVITFLSSAVGLKERTHLNVDILPYMLPLKPRSILLMLIDLMLIWFGYMMMVNSYGLAVFNWTTEIPLLDIPLGVRSIPLIISGFLIILFCFNNFLRNLLCVFTGEEPDEADDTVNPLTEVELREKT